MPAKATAGVVVGPEGHLVRNHLEVVDLYVELTRNRWMPEDSYAYEPVSRSRPDDTPQLRRV
eukprot:226100-Prymnesium_polylepis.1